MRSGGRARTGRLRYERKLGEHLRGEVTALQRALADAGSIATKALGLGLAERRQKLREDELDFLMRAVLAAINAAGGDLEAQHRAKQVLARTEGHMIEEGQADDS